VPDAAGRGFVVGAPRSGTTLLINLIAAHPKVAPIYETGFINHLLLLWDAQARRSASGWNSKMYLGTGRHVQARQAAHDARKFIAKLLSFSHNEFRTADRDSGGRQRTSRRCTRRRRVL
jgi:hypothetical protein